MGDRIEKIIPANVTFFSIHFGTIKYFSLTTRSACSFFEGRNRVVRRLLEDRIEKTDYVIFFQNKIYRW